MGNPSLYIGRPDMGSRIESAVESGRLTVRETTAAAIPQLDADETGPDCVVTDHDPPKLDCFELLEAVDPELPVVVAPTDGSSELATRALRAGAETYLDPAAVEDAPAAIAAEIDRVVAGHPQRADERIERFASLVSHELRGPIQKANSGIDLARTECDSDYLDQVGETLDRMDDLVDNLLDELKDGEPTIETEAVELSSVVEDAWPEGSGATLSVESDLPTVEAEGSRVRQLFDNVFRNSLEHGAAGSQREAADGDSDSDSLTVRVGVIESPGFGSTGLYIADDGPGIDADPREKIFEYGYTGSEDGTGYGLAIVKEIVDTFGWEIAVTDSDAGGARFELRNMKTV